MRRAVTNFKEGWTHWGHGWLEARWRGVMWFLHTMQVDTHHWRWFRFLSWTLSRRADCIRVDVTCTMAAGPRLLGIRAFWSNLSVALSAGCWILSAFWEAYPREMRYLFNRFGGRRSIFTNDAPDWEVDTFDEDVNKPALAIYVYHFARLGKVIVSTMLKSDRVTLIGCLYLGMEVPFSEIIWTMANLSRKYLTTSGYVCNTCRSRGSWLRIEVANAAEKAAACIQLLNVLARVLCAKWGYTHIDASPRMKAVP